MDMLAQRLRVALPDETAALAEQHLRWLDDGDFQAVLASEEARTLLASDTNIANEERYDGDALWTDWLLRRLEALLSDRSRLLHQQVIYFVVGYAALLAFVQASVTGPPLPFDPATVLLPATIVSDAKQLKLVRQNLLSSLTKDGIAAYKLTPNVELLCLAEAVLTNPTILKSVDVAKWARMRVMFTQQRLLYEVSSTLQTVIYDDLANIEQDLTNSADYADTRNARSHFLLERAAIHLHHGLDKLARADIEQAAAVRDFHYRLTGRLGKRTKFQQHDVSQLVVLAKSADLADTVDGSDDGDKCPTLQEHRQAQPESIDLNDDTLLERIAFSETATSQQSPKTLPLALADLDPSNQPQLEPLDSAILLSFASSITNTSPEDGLTREELLPYANRVLDGGSSNWQIYTQALLVRSRVEGYKSRTVERGLLQLQALVDQVIAETTNIATVDAAPAVEPASSTFLPRPKQSESAPVSERLRFIFQLASPSRWEMEAELAARWISLGGLRSALEIYERLQMWAEAALCWAATENEDKARKIVRRQLFHRSSEESVELEDESWEGPVRHPAPSDAPRLYCILGDMDQSVEMYETAWNVSGQRYARAQRAIGRHFFAKREYEPAVEAYTKSLKVNQLNHQSWFALGCALIELERYNKAVEAFSRCVQLDDSDAEAWSNFAAALLRADPADEPEEPDDEPSVNDLAVKPVAASSQRNRINALKAFQRAATIKSDSYRIWQNVLVTAASLTPPDYASVFSAQKKVIDLRGKTDGEKCVDEDILEQLIQHVIQSADTYDASKPGIERMTVKLVDEAIVPMITASAHLWRLVSKLALWRQKPGTALEAEEKAWRAITTQPGWETQSESRWNDIVEATIRLCDSYQSLGSRERTEGLGAGDGSLVARDWKFKARSAIRGIMNRGKDSWQDTDGWTRLQEAQESLKG